MFTVEQHELNRSRENETCNVYLKLISLRDVFFTSVSFNLTNLLPIENHQSWCYVDDAKKL